MTDSHRGDLVVDALQATVGFWQASWRSGPPACRGDRRTSRPQRNGGASNGVKVCVADRDNGRIQQFSTSGVFLLQWGGKGSGNGKFSFPWGAVTDQAGCVYVSDRFNHRIQKFHDGAYVAKFGSPGSGDGQLSEPFGVAVDLGGRVYVADWGNYRIQVFEPA